MSRSLAALLGALMEEVSRQCPEATTAMASRCAGLAVGVSVEGERFAVVVDGEGPRVTEGLCGEGARVEASRAVLRALILGDDDVDAAARGDRLGVYASPDALVKMDELVRLLVAGAARSAGAGRLLDEFLKMT